MVVRVNEEACTDPRPLQLDLFPNNSPSSDGLDLPLSSKRKLVQLTLHNLKMINLSFVYSDGGKDVLEQALGKIRHNAASGIKEMLSI